LPRSSSSPYSLFGLMRPVKLHQSSGRFSRPLFLFAFIVVPFLFLLLPMPSADWKTTLFHRSRTQIFPPFLFKSICGGQFLINCFGFLRLFAIPPDFYILLPFKPQLADPNFPFPSLKSVPYPRSFVSVVALVPFPGRNKFFFS